MSRYGELADLYTHGAPSSSFGSLTDQQRLEGLEAASSEIDDHLRARGKLPLVSWGDSIKQRCCHIAAYELMCRVGFNPAAGSDKNILDRAIFARDWLRRVSKGEVTPECVFATTPNAHAQPRVRSKPTRGW